MPRNRYLVPHCGHLPTRHVLVISENVVFPDGTGPGAVHIKRRTIQRTVRQEAESPMAITQLAEQVENLGGVVLDVGSAVVSPGVVDLSTHFSDPGNLAYEGIKRGTAAAAAGGVTTVVDMPVFMAPAITDARKLAKRTARAWVRSPLLHTPTFELFAVDRVRQSAHDREFKPGP